MTARLFGLAALFLIPGLSSQIHAGEKSDFPRATGDYPPSQTSGNLSAYYGMTPNFANYGLPGTYPGYGGYSYQAYGPGAQFGAHYPAAIGSKATPPSTNPAPRTRPAPRPSAPRTSKSRSATLLRKGL